MPKGLLLFALLLYSFYVAAQAQPYSFSHPNLTQNIPVQVMPKVDAVRLLKEDALDTLKENPYRFGYMHPVSYDMSNSGLREVLNDGSILWRFEVECPQAYSVNLTFSQFNIPPGAQLYLYNISKSYIVGPYTSRDMNATHRFGTGLCQGEEIIAEYYEPFYAAFHGQLTLSGITHAYKDPFQLAKSFDQSGACDTNTICPIASAWQDDKRAVAMIIVGGTSLCSGAMIGNTTLDGTPYFLTAYHCYDTTVATWVFMFNYESPSCSPSVNGIMTNTVSGAQLISLNMRSDFCLLELFSQPDTAYHIYYTGWNNVDSAADSEICIHHPNGDVKKISFAYTPAVSDGWFANDGTHWSVNWNIGDTEPGSSGSPLFDQYHHVVGQLHGGNSSCQAGQTQDLFGKFAVSWNGPVPSQRLKDWLDPTNSGLTFIHGYYPSQPKDSLNAQLYSVLSPIGTNCAGDTIFPVINVKNLGTDALTSMQVQYSIDGGIPVTYNWTGRITTFINLDILLPAFGVATGVHTFFVSLNHPNNGTDQDMSDNSLTVTFNVINGADVTVEVLTDDFPDETSYNLINESGDTVLRGGNFIYDSTLYVSKICLVPGCYIFKIYDSGGDGICCAFGNGFYKIYTRAGDTLAKGGQFDSLDVKNFCVYSNGVPDVSQYDGINIYPNPTTGAVKVEWVKYFERIDIEVLNSIGQDMRKESYYNTNSGSVNLNKLPQGVYMLKINLGDYIIIKKVVLFNP